jgi:endonuclease/exonuclease/phosphatase family metal-dependent hydrolase
MSIPLAPSLRVMTYNVHGCVGVDRRLDVPRVARVIAASGADVVALQELDVGRPRSHGVDQPRALAQRLGMEHVFYASRTCEGGRYGNAVLSRLPLALVRAGALPRAAACEDRAVQWVEVRAGRAVLNVLNTHLGLDHDERERQVSALLSEQWLGAALGSRPTVLCGDFNVVPESSVYAALSGPLRDAQRAAANGGRPRATFPSPVPWRRIDYVFFGPGLRARRCHVEARLRARVASDHLPLWTDLEIAEGTP